jgi:hypothetical protein
MQAAYWIPRSDDAHHTITLDGAGTQVLTPEKDRTGGSDGRLGRHVCRDSIRGDYTGAGCLLENAIKRCTPHNKPLTQASEKATTRG